MSVSLISERITSYPSCASRRAAHNSRFINFHPVIERGQGTQLFVIRLIHVNSGLKILSFQLQNHSTSLMPIRRIGLQQCVHSFFSIREYPFSPRHPCSTSTNKLDNNMILPLVPAAHRLTSKRCYPVYFSLRRRAPARVTLSPSA